MHIEMAIQKLLEKENLTAQMTYDSMSEIMRGEVSPIKIATFLTAFRMKGETAEEILGASRVVREKATPVDIAGSDFVDTCGTGGDGAHTFNISTTAMFIAAACGVKIAKHGNRAITSKSGAADVLEALGARIDLTPKAVSDCMNHIGIGFMFAPHFHASFKYAMPVRKELGFKTVFNILGPLANPAKAKRQLLGVYDQRLVLKMAEVLHQLGTEQAMVVHGEDGLDEITLTGKTYVAELKDGKLREYEIRPQDFGFDVCQKEDLFGGTPDENARMTREILGGKGGAKRDIAVLNAGAAIYVGQRAESFAAGVEKARKAVESKAAMTMLERFVACTRGEA